MRIAIDAMGGDHAPDAILAGSIDSLALLAPEDRLVLVGDEQIIRESLEERGVDGDQRIQIVATTQVVEMAETPVTALRAKPDSSILRMAQLGGRRAADKRCDVVFSAGNTGACVAAAQMSMRCLSGVHRPGIAITMPGLTGPLILCDAGANPDPKPMHLYQYGHMASVFATRAIGVNEPRVAILSIGGEETKGTLLVKETHKLMKSDGSLNYVGYCEGRDLFEGRADVVIAEGFTGNVVLKLAEGLASGLFNRIIQEVVAIDPDLALKLEPIVRHIYRRHDYHEYGGAPLLGANGICLIGHGTSEARTIVNAVKAAKKYVEYRINEGIVETLARAALASKIPA